MISITKILMYYLDNKLLLKTGLNNTLTFYVKHVISITKILMFYLENRLCFKVYGVKVLIGMGFRIRN